MERIVIIGGGFTGTAAAIQLLRAATRPIEVTVVERRATVGPGLAYGATDPDHRINGSIDSHFVDPADPYALRRWCERTGLFERDREALAANGVHYIRRSDFGAFLADAFHEAAKAAPDGSRLEHRHAQATALRRAGDGWRLEATKSPPTTADAVILATGNGAPRVPPGFAPDLHAHPAFHGDALAGRLAEIPRDARVLVVGSGLTALDTTSTLLRRGHAGPIVVASRHGLRAQPQRPPNPDGSGERLMARIEGSVPPFVTAALQQPTARALVHAVRARIRERAREGVDWYGPFDELRDVVWQVWPRLPAREKRRFMARIRPFYDAARFRSPPQNDLHAGRAVAAGQLSFVRARIDGAAPAGEGIEVRWRPHGVARPGTARFDAVVNCTGLDPSCGAADNPLLADLVAQGVLRPDPSGAGFEVDAQCRPLGANGGAEPRLRMLGPPTAGTFGDPLGVLFIAPQIRRMLPGLLQDLAGVPANISHG